MNWELDKVKAQFMEAARRAYQRGIQTGNGGNISARVPGQPLMIVKPSGVSLIDCTPETVIVTDFDGNVIEGNRKPTREAVLHGELYRNLPGVGGVVHTHSPWSIAWSFTGRDLPLLALHTQLKLACPVPVRFFASPKGVLKEEIPVVLDLFVAHPDLTGFIMGAHGVVAIGPDVLEAEHSAELIEETAQVGYLHEVGANASMLSLGPAVIGNRDIAWITREALVACGRKVAAKGLVIGPEGSISARCGSAIYILAHEATLSEADPEDFIEVDLSSGQWLHGKRQPSSDVLMHLACYRTRPEIRAVIYSCPPMFTAAASCGPWTGDAAQDFMHSLGEVACLVEMRAGTSEVAALESSIRRHDAVFLADKGLLAVGGDLSEALYRTELVERKAHMLFLARSFGGSGQRGA